MRDLDGGGFEIPESVKDYLRAEGFELPCDAMEGHIRAWDDWLAARGEFYDYRDTDAVGRVYEVHRRSIRPAKRVCREWSTLLLNENVTIATEDQGCTEWLEDYLRRVGFLQMAQGTIQRAFGLGTGAWALWVDAGTKEMRIRGYDARMVVPLSWDQGQVTECAFCTRAYDRGKAIGQLQMHLRGEGGYEIETVCFNEDGEEVSPDGVLGRFATSSTWPTFAIVRPAIENTLVDMSPYGMSVFEDAVDVIQAVDLAFDALINEVDIGKMRIFLSDVMFDVDRDGGKAVSIPFGKQDCTVFRKVMTTEDTIHELAPALRTGQQRETLRIALQTMGDLCGFGIGYFDLDEHGGIRTAAEVSSDNSALMRNIRAHENGIERALRTIAHATLALERQLEPGCGLSDEGEVTIGFDDSIVTDTAAEKAQDMLEVNVTMAPWEYRAKWYGESEETAGMRAKILIAVLLASVSGFVEVTAASVGDCWSMAAYALVFLLTDLWIAFPRLLASA